MGKSFSVNDVYSSSYLIGNKIYPKCTYKAEVKKDANGYAFHFIIKKGENELDSKFVTPNKKDRGDHDANVKRFNTKMVMLLKGVGIDIKEVQNAEKDVTSDQGWLVMVRDFINDQRKTVRYINVKTIYNQNGYCTLAYDRPIEPYVEGEKPKLEYSDYETREMDKNPTSPQKKGRGSMQRSSGRRREEEEEEEEDYDGEDRRTKRTSPGKPSSQRGKVTSTRRSVEYEENEDEYEDDDLDKELDEPKSSRKSKSVGNRRRRDDEVDDEYEGEDLDDIDDITGEETEVDDDELELEAEDEKPKRSGSSKSNNKKPVGKTRREAEDEVLD